MREITINDLELVSGAGLLDQIAASTAIGGALGGGIGIGVADSMGASGTAVLGFAGIGGGIAAGLVASFGTGYAVGTLIEDYFDGDETQW